MVTGRCLCTKIQFEIASPVASASHCHCESCRRAHSAAFVTWSSFAKSQLKFIAGEGLLKKYESSPGVLRSFCSVCGSPLFYEADSEPGAMYVPTAALGTPTDLVATRHVSFEEKVPWLNMHDGLPKYFGKDSLIK